MRGAGVGVYFVDGQTFGAISASEDHGKEVIDSLHG
jgi:hypothetical protein